MTPESVTHVQINSEVDIMKKILMLSALLLSFLMVSASVPGKIPVQGTLMDKDGNLISDDAAQIIFIIYDAETDGNELWREERTLFVEKGKLAVYLGEIEPVTVEKIGGQDELWLSVTYGGEEMSRIQLGSVPYALEAQTAHSAEAIGKYTETTLDDYFSAACAEGSYLRGWSGTSPICETDEGGESSGTTYTAGTGIIINGEVISIDQTIDLYVAGTGIDIDAGTNTISVNPSVFATTDHNHDGRYYLKSETYTKTESDDRFYNYESGSHTDNSLVAFNGGALKNSPVTITADGNTQIYGQDNNHSHAALEIVSPTSGDDQVLLLDGNEISSNGKIYLNTNSLSAEVEVGQNDSSKENEQSNLHVNGSLSSNTVDSDTVNAGTVNSSTITNSGNVETDTLQVKGDVQVYDDGVGWRDPIKIKRYSGLGNDVSYNTGYSTSEWCAAMVGFNSGNMDISEDSDADVKVYLYKSSGTWRIRANIANDSNAEDWMVKVMFIRVELADCSEDS